MDDEINWFDDNIIEGAFANMGAWLRALDLEAAEQSEVVRKTEEAARNHLSCVLALDPAKIRDEYERIYDAASDIGTNASAAAQIDLTRDHLVAWKGDASDAFRKQLTYIKMFCEQQKEYLLRGLQGVTATLAVAIEGRASYLSLMEATSAAADNYISEQKAKETAAKIALVADLAGGFLTCDPNSLKKSVAATLLEVGKSIAPVVLDDSGPAQVCDSYYRHAEILCQSLGHAYDQVQNHLAGLRKAASEQQHELFAPLPAYCDVESPDFTYERFNNTVHDPGPIGPQVEAERQKYADEKQQESEIERRLDHGDKGAV